MKKYSAIISTVISAAILLTGCGGNGKSPGVSSTESSSSLEISSSLESNSSIEQTESSVESFTEHTEISEVKEAYLKLCAASWTEFPGNDDDIDFLGKIPENAEVYSIIPSEKGADAALAQGEFQGYKIERGWQYFPSQFAIYILDENGVMFTVEEYQKTHDFKPIYDLLPEGMKGWSF